MWRSGALAAALLASAVPAAAADAPPLSTNGFMFDVVLRGDRAYVVGSFDMVGRPTGAGAGFDGGSGAIDQGFTPINGQVSDAVPDGRGGWYIGGEFRAVGQLRVAYVAHLNTDGSVDPTFDATSAVKGFVGALVLQGDVLYAGGKIAGRSAPTGSQGPVAALDARTGQAIPGFRPPAAPAARELALSGSTLYVGTETTLTALDATTGATVPGFRPLQGMTPVHSLLASGSDVYVGSHTLVALDGATGAPDPGFSRLVASPTKDDPESGFFDVLLLSGGRLYAGGETSRIGSAARPLVSLDPATGALDPAFAPVLNGAVYDVAMVGGALWAGGTLGPGSDNGSELDGLDPATGQLLHRASGRFDGQVFALAGDGTTGYVGGNFQLAGALPRANAFAVSAKSGVFDPVFAPHLAPGDSIVPGGGHVYGIDNEASPTNPCSSSGAATVRVLDPDSGRQLASAQVRELRAVAGDDRALYTVQQTTRKCGSAGTLKVFVRNAVGVRDPSNGHLRQMWKIPFPGYVTDAVATADRLYVAGSFRRFRANGQPAHLAIIAIDRATGHVDESFDPHARGPVYSLVGGANSLFASGLYDRVQQVRRPGLARLDLPSGLLDVRFRPRIAGGAFIQLLAPVDGALTRLGGRDTLGSSVLIDETTGRFVAPLQRNVTTVPTPFGRFSLGDERINAAPVLYPTTTQVLRFHPRG